MARLATLLDAETGKRRDDPLDARGHGQHGRLLEPPEQKMIEFPWLAVILIPVIVALLFALEIYLRLVEERWPFNRSRK